MIVIVGGNARNVGKTTLVCDLISATRPREWIAVKISGHPHGTSPLPIVSGKPRATELFLAAGAAEVHLLRETEASRNLLADLAASGRNLIVESNRAVTWIPFDHYIFILDEAVPDPKPRDRWHLERAFWLLPPRQAAPPALVAAMN